MENEERISKTSPPHLLKFNAIEHENFLTTTVRFRQEFQIFSQLDGLYADALSEPEVPDKNFILYQILFLVHYHFLFATSCMMRAHLSEAFASARVAIDACLVASKIIEDRGSQEAYINRSKPFDKLVRHFKNLIRDNKPLPHELVRHLIGKMDFCSEYASHADINVFAHRLKIEDGVRKRVAVEYFQFPRDDGEFRFFFLDLLHIFVMILDVFSVFLVDEIGKQSENWRVFLRRIGATVESRREEMKVRIDEENSQ